MESKNNKSRVLMFLFGPLETDARVLRSIDTVLKKGYELLIITYGTTSSFSPSGGYVIRDIKKKFSNRYLTQLYFTIYTCIYYLFNRRDFNIIYLQDYYSTVPGEILSLFVRQKKIIYDAHELLIAPKRYINDFKTKFYIWVERKLIKKNNVIVVEANRERERIMKLHYGLKNITSVLNISKYTTVSICNRTLPKDDIYIVYQGAMAAERNIPFYIRALKCLSNRIKLLLIGDGPCLSSYYDIIKSENLEDRVIITGRLSNIEMMERLKGCSVGIITYSFSDWNNIFCSPNKIFEYSAISLPFIATDQPFMDTIARKYKIGRTFIHDSEQSFVHNLHEILSNYDFYVAGMKRFLDDYNYDAEMERLSAIL